MVPMKMKTVYIYIYIFISQKINFIYLKKQYYMNRKISIKVSQGVLGNKCSLKL